MHSRHAQGQPSNRSDSSEGAREGRAPTDADPADDRTTLLDVLVNLAEYRSLIVWTTVAVTLLGAVYSLLASEEYTSDAKVVRESQEEMPSLGSLGGLGGLQGLGLNFGLSESGLSVSAFPKVLESREVRLAVVRDTFAFPDEPRPMTFVEYVNRPPGTFDRVLKYTVRLPWTIKDALIGKDSLVVGMSSDAPGASGVMVLNREEMRALRAVRDMVMVSTDNESGLMTIEVTASTPSLASDFTQSFVQHLSDRVRTIRTQKVEERLQFVEERFAQAERDLKEAEDRLAQFLERNQNPNTASLRFQQDRLERQVSFEEQLYSQIQNQLTKTRLELQRRQPVLTVVERPVPPLQRSWPARTLIVLVSLFLGASLGIGLALLVNLIREEGHEEEWDRVRTLLTSLTPSVVRRRWPKMSE